MKRFAPIGRWIFGLSAAVSLLLCVISGGLWARSAGHFEMVQLRYARWPQETELHSYYVGLSWFSNTLRLEFIHLPFGPKHLEGQSAEWVRDFREQYPPRARWFFVGEETTAEMSGFPPGFRYWHHPYQTAGVTGGSYLLSVRAWLPTLLAAILPLAWFVWYRRQSGTLWRFGLRELFVGVTVIAVVMSAALWLMN